MPATHHITGSRTLAVAGSRHDATAMWQLLVYELKNVLHPLQEMSVLLHTYVCFPYYFFILKEICSYRVKYLTFLYTVTKKRISELIQNNIMQNIYKFITLTYIILRFRNLYNTLNMFTHSYAFD